MLSRFRVFWVFLCDSAILIAVALILSRFSIQYGIPDVVSRGLLPSHLLLLYVCTFIFQILFHTYDSLWRYAESREYLFLLLAALCGFCTYEVVNRFVLNTRVISFLLLAAIAGLWVLGMLGIRFAYRVYRDYKMYRQGNHRVPVAIVGAGAAGVQLYQELRSNADSHYSVRCFFDDDPAKIGKRVHNVIVRGKIQDVPKWVRSLELHEIIVAIPSASESRRHEILQQLSALDHVKITVLPSTLDLIGHKNIRSQLREVRIEDLLGREPVEMDQGPVDVFLRGKCVLVTGGGGSIGSELCRQIAKHRPRQLVIVDIYENNAYDIQQELCGCYRDQLALHVEIASVRDQARIRQLFDQYRPEVVFHAAAHKHVPLMENSPQEAVRNNVFGTLNVIQAAEKFRVEKFILISTDKAVNPTSVMGATKRLCEMLLQSMKGTGNTSYAAVRFGNVLGSNGSVVPLFRRQIAQGGPITLTDKRMVRYFMTIEEASQLVLRAGAMAGENELYVLDMGEPVPILTLAENMIRLSGYMPYKDIDIVEIGLRPGEKLYEEPLIQGRDIRRTENAKIFVEQQPPMTREDVYAKLALLEDALKKNTPGAIRAALHQAVPTFHKPEEVNEAGAGAASVQPRQPIVVRCQEKQSTLYTQAVP